MRVTIHAHVPSDVRPHVAEIAAAIESAGWEVDPEDVDVVEQHSAESREILPHKLSAYELELLGKIDHEWRWVKELGFLTPTALVVYRERGTGLIQAGRCRSRRVQHSPFDRDDAGTTYLEVSPVPGAWELIKLDDVLAVRNIDIL